MTNPKTVVNIFYIYEIWSWLVGSADHEELDSYFSAKHPSQQGVEEIVIKHFLKP
jgi:hypothetical protein